MLLTLNIVKHEFDKIAPYLVMATKTASKHLKWAQVFQHVEHLWQFEGRSSKQRLNIWAQYIYWRIYGYGCILWRVFDHQLLDVGLEVCGRAGQDLAKQDISCVNIQIFLLEPSHSGEPEKLFYHTMRSDLHCMFSETNISYRADRPKLCFGQTCWQDFLLKKGNGTNYAVRHGMTQSGQIRWENQTVSNSLTNSFGHFFSFPPKLTFINITLTFRVNFITRKIMNDKTKDKYQYEHFHKIL